MTVDSEREVADAIREGAARSAAARGTGRYRAEITAWDGPDSFQVDVAGVDLTLNQDFVTISQAVRAYDVSPGLSVADNLVLIEVDTDEFSAIGVESGVSLPAPADADAIQDAFAAQDARLDTLEALGISSSYAPAWTATGTAPSLGDGSRSGEFARIGDLVWVAINLVPGSSTTFGTGIYSLSLPVAARAGLRQVLGGVLTDGGLQSYDLDVVLNGSPGGHDVPEEILAASNTIGPTNWQHNVPFTFGNGDRLTISGMYLAA